MDQTAAVVFYPRCVACTEGLITWPGHTRLMDGEPQPAETLDVKSLTPVEFVNLPAAIFEVWWEAVQEVNPRWALRRAVETPEQAAATEKKG